MIKGVRMLQFGRKWTLPTSNHKRMHHGSLFSDQKTVFTQNILISFRFSDNFTRKGGASSFWICRRKWTHWRIFHYRGRFQIFLPTVSFITLLDEQDEGFKVWVYLINIRKCESMLTSCYFLSSGVLFKPLHESTDGILEGVWTDQATQHLRAIWCTSSCQAV